MAVARAVVWGAVLALCSGGCALWLSHAERAAHYAQQHRLQPWTLTVDDFTLTAYARITSPRPDPLIIFIEGDGYSWINPVTVSQDPTPHQPLALHLAAADPAPDVLYLSRLCQFAGRQSPACRSQHWTSHRYAAEVVQTMSRAVDQAVERTQARSIALVGYSGGGVIAALLVVQRRDVRWWMTVAANLDLHRWTDHHRVTAMASSLNPVDQAEQLTRIPQLHLVGGKDAIVPELVIRSYQRHLPQSSGMTIEVIPDFDHHCCWQQAWPRLRQTNRLD
ncbi:MAG: alpha/beta hydrolase [Magnetococcales bacterium]|nr:alpha/beta hydrolase [Magnetococcales bacterium]